MYNINSIYSKDKKKHPVFITAEIGINHQGNADFAKHLIEKAWESGADAVKFQVYKTEKFYNRDLAPKAFEMFKSFELSFDEYYKLCEFSNSLGLIFYATPFDNDSLDFLLQIGTPIVKVASSDITNEPFLNYIAEKSPVSGFLTILSTGFVRLAEIDSAVHIFRSRPFAVLYCVSKYPVKPEEIDLKIIAILRERYNASAGFSDHSMGITLSLGAVALGASLIERHFTTDRSIPGADHSISLEPAMFKSMVDGIRDIEKASSTGDKKITDFEKQTKYMSMRGMYASRKIMKGEIIRKGDVIMLRPGDGVKLSEYKKLLNRKAARDILLYEKI